MPDNLLSLFLSFRHEVFTRSRNAYREGGYVEYLHGEVTPQHIDH